MSTTNDPHIGETYEDRDTRSNGRRVRILELHPKQSGPKQWDGSAWVDDRYYRAVRVDEFGNHVGQRVRIAARTLGTHYRKVSH